MRTGELRGDKVTLRLLHKEHVADYCAMLSPTVCAALHLHHIPSEHAYLLERLHDPHLFFYTMYASGEDRLIGGIEIRSADVSRGQLYSWIHESYWGTGCFREALVLASQEYFMQSNELFFTAHVDVTNKRSYWAMKKCGFADYGMCEGPYGRQYQMIYRRR